MLPTRIPKHFVVLAIFVVACLFLVLHSSGISPRAIRESSRTSPSLQSQSNDAGYNHNANPISNYNSNNSDCYVDLNLLKSFGDYNATEYARYEFNVVRSKNFTSWSDNLDVPLPAYRSLRLDTADSKGFLPDDLCAPTIRIEAPPVLPPIDASHLIFGVATSLDRLGESLDAFAHWAGGTNTRIIAVVDDVWEWNKGPVERKAKALGVRLTIIESVEDVLDRYYSLTRILLREREPSTKWAIIIDDDTFFPSMKNLVNRLETYNASMPYYIGAPTESLAQMGIFNFMAYGGAGIILSFPLLEEMDKVYDLCYEFKEGGDKRISRCIYMNTLTKLTWERRLFQLDIWEASGFYEAGRPLPLSVHHWKSWFHADIPGMSKIAAICGDDCQLRRFRISPDTFLINGFSFIKYSAPMYDMIRMEQTWDPSPWAREEGYAFSLGPLRPMDEEKISLRLRTAITEEKKVRQIYVREPPEDHPEEPLQVLEIVWKEVDGE